MFENPRRGRQGRNFTTNVSKILDLKSSSEQIFFRKLSLGAPVGSIGRIPELFDKKLEQRTIAFSIFYGAGSNRILGNDERVGVPVFTNRKMKTTKKRNRRQSNPE